MNLEELLGEALAGLPPPPEPKRLHVPLRSAVDEFEDWASRPQDRVYTGLAALDIEMRGTAPGQLTLIQGYAHQGKTLVASEIILNNPERRIALFTPDETRTLILVKLTCALHRVSARSLEAWIAAGNPEARRMMVETCERYPTLSVVDDSLSIPDMHRAVDEMEEAFGGAIDAVIFDYAALLDHGEDIRAKVQALKQFGKSRKVALFVLHQASRTSGKDGQAMTISSGEYGGEKEATHVVGVRRKKAAIGQALREARESLSKPSTSAATRDRLEEQVIPELLYELERHANTVTVSLLKNKTPPCGLVDELDLVIDPDTGRILGPIDGLLVRPKPQDPMPNLTPAERALRGI